MRYKKRVRVDNVYVYYDPVVPKKKKKQVKLTIRQRAIKKNQPRYNTGKPCKHGHLDDRIASTGSCVTCYNLKLKSKPGRKYYLLQKYNLTLEQFDKMLIEQNGSCCICSDDLKSKPCVDHDHKTGKIRQLLCGPCNSGLGYFRENVESLKNAILYLEKHNFQTLENPLSSKI